MTPPVRWPEVLFFTHVDRSMRLMAGLLERNRAPSELMRLHEQEDDKTGGLRG